MVGDTVEEQVPALGVHVHGEVLEDVHVAAVSNAAHAGTVPLCPYKLYCLGAHVPKVNIFYIRLTEPRLT